MHRFGQHRFGQHGFGSFIGGAAGQGWVRP